MPPAPARHPSGLAQGSWRLPFAVPAPHAKNADISILRAGSDPFKVKQIEAERTYLRKTTEGKSLVFSKTVESLGDQKGHPQCGLLWGKLGQARSHARSPRDQRPKAGGH